MPGAKHLNALTIRGFRGLEHAEFDKLGQFNVIVGNNDVGKTSVLEAVFLSTGLAVPQLAVTIQNQRVHAVVDSSDLSLLFHDFDVVRRSIELVASTPSDIRQLTIALEPADVAIDQDVPASGGLGNGDGAPSGTTTYSSKPDVPLELRYYAKLETRHPRESVGYRGALSVANGKVKTMDGRTGSRLRDQSIIAKIVIPGLTYDRKAISEVIIRKKQPVLINVLQFINPHVTAITVGEDVAYVDIGLDTMIPLNMCGSGLVQAANIVSSCIVGDANVLLIDDIGHGLHYSSIRAVLEAVIEICEQRDIQTFCTTHSLEVIQCVHQVLGNDSFGRFRDKMKTFKLARDKDDRVRVYRYDYDSFEHFMSQGLELR